MPNKCWLNLIPLYNGTSTWATLNVSKTGRSDSMSWCSPGFCAITLRPGWMPQQFVLPATALQITPHEGSLSCHTAEAARSLHLRTLQWHKAIHQLDVQMTSMKASYLLTPKRGSWVLAEEHRTDLFFIFSTMALPLKYKSRKRNYTWCESLTQT